MIAPESAAASNLAAMVSNIGGSTESIKYSRLELIRKRSPALRWICHSSPSALRMPSAR